MKIKRDKYGLTPAQRKRMLENQFGVCAICHIELTYFPEDGKEFFVGVIDHNHKTGKVRGFLCSFCNSAIGFLQDNPSTAFFALLYLAKHENHKMYKQLNNIFKK